MKTNSKTRGTRVFFGASIGLAVIILMVGARPASAQWSGPDASNNVYYNGGNVGIGTSTPNKSSASRALTINGSTDVIYELAIGDVRKGNIYHTGTNMSVFNNANGPLLFGTNNSEKARIDASGNFGFGTTAHLRPRCGGEYAMGGALQENRRHPRRYHH